MFKEKGCKNLHKIYNNSVTIADMLLKILNVFIYTGTIMCSLIVFASRTASGSRFFLFGRSVDNNTMFQVNFVLVKYVMLIQ